MDDNERRIFFVRDNGVGFDKKYADRLFEAFQRLHTAAEFEGMGIGLSAVRQIVERHGGQLWVDAVLGKGATFYFTIDMKYVTGSPSTNAAEVQHN